MYAVMRRRPSDLKSMSNVMVEFGIITSSKHLTLLNKV